MVLPVFKVLSLVIRVFSKPLINYTKQVHLRRNSDQHPLLRKGFISLGNTYNRWEAWINRKFLKIESQFAYKPLNDELAIEKGIEFFYEILFYSIIIGIPLYQIIRTAAETKAKSKALEQKLKKFEDELQDLKDDKKQRIKNQEGKKEKKEAVYISQKKEFMKKGDQQKNILQKSGQKHIKRIRLIYQNKQLCTIHLNPRIKEFLPVPHSQGEKQESQKNL